MRSANRKIDRQPRNNVFVKPDEILVPDERSQQRPADVVEDKLTCVLKGGAVLVSGMRLKNLIGRRTGLG